MLAMHGMLCAAQEKPKQAHIESDILILSEQIVPHEKIVSLMYFSDSKGNKIDPVQLGIEHEAIEGAYDVTLFEDLGNGQTKLTFIGNEPMESAKNSGQLEGWNQILDKLAAVVAGLTQAK
jgi:uncharacterized protein YndB with AHSA1/START domain